MIAMSKRIPDLIMIIVNGSKPLFTIVKAARGLKLVKLAMLILSVAFVRL